MCSPIRQEYSISQYQSTYPTIKWWIGKFILYYFTSSFQRQISITTMLQVLVHLRTRLYYSIIEFCTLLICTAFVCHLELCICCHSISAPSWEARSSSGFPVCLPKLSPHFFLPTNPTLPTYTNSLILYCSVIRICFVVSWILPHFNGYWSTSGFGPKETTIISGR